jgi:predicted TIM-barrel fold metal-dependent hydrolase
MSPNPRRYSSGPTRRQFLQCGVASAFAAAALPSSMRATGASATIPFEGPITDTNAYLGEWPIRHLALAESAALQNKFSAQKVTSAWVGSLDVLFHKDLAEVNARVAKICAGSGVLRPVGAVNPALPRWEEDIERCAKLGMHVIRLHPNYHSYKLDDPRFIELLKLATAQKLSVQIAVVMEDERTQHPLLRVPPVDVGPLPQALEAVPEARVMLLNWQRSTSQGPTMTLLKNTQVMFDIAMLEGMAGIEALLGELPLERIVFGSYAPVFYFESAKLKLQESDLDEKQLRAITHENAQRFIAG